MTNDNTPSDADQRRLKAKYEAALAMLVDTFLETGLHPLYMQDGLKRQLEWAEEAVRSSS